MNELPELPRPLTVRICTGMLSAGLSPRESQCVWLYITGSSLKGIAAALGISPHTAKHCLVHARNKIDRDGRVPYMSAINMLRMLAGVAPSAPLERLAA